MSLRAALAVPLLVLTPLFAQDPATCPLHSSHSAASSPYIGEEGRSIKSLSDEQIGQLLAGEGMGLAKPAELNHYPGPKHLLDLADSLGIGAAERSQLQAIFDAMHEAAVATGKDLIAAEEALDARFASGQATGADVDRLTLEVARQQGLLRAIHLRAHVEARALLTAEQISRYDQLRGYTTAAKPSSQQGAATPGR